MAFKCLKNEEVIYSFQYELPEWIALKEDKKSDFKMPCCGADAILKTSRLGTQFFAHKPRKNKSDCKPSKESPEHTHIKYLVSKELYRQGWDVQVEKKGETDDGETWIADVYAEKGQAKIAIEVQWSPQSFVETKRRHELYEKSGVRCVWLLRSTSKKDVDAVVGDYTYNTKKMPVFSIYKNKREKNSEYMVRNVISDITFNRSGDICFEEVLLSITEFVAKLVNKKLVFKEKYKSYSNLNLSVVNGDCWLCGTKINCVSTVNMEDIRFGKIAEPLIERVIVDNIDYKEHSAFIDFINENYAEQYNFAPLRYRYSSSYQSNCLVNSCSKCDASVENLFLRMDFRPKNGVLTHSCHVSVAEHDNRNREVGRWFLVE